MGVLRTLFSFAKTQGYYFAENPAKDRKILSHKDRDKTGFGIFEKEEIKKILCSSFMRKAKAEDKDYYWTLVFVLYSGARIDEIAGLTQKQFKVSEGGVLITSLSTTQRQKQEFARFRCLNSFLMKA